MSPLIGLVINVSTRLLNKTDPFGMYGDWTLEEWFQGAFPAFLMIALPLALILTAITFTDIYHIMKRL